ncbi:NADP-dependent oxidoreductase [Sulfitobacter sp. EhC04]|uniref:NADP-dependent oxidoreductase n=1 Tax=Sulfitobacter sp. EhC04 TaxID=1849168 RepID=UPI0007F38CC0|nr:NADP-dependent oxidoreductase [Sulfitobacter sp. EhC04]OAN75283.1 NADP-dependent oxidoreductase [Sulfitobacter sp. EhC04]
MSSQMQQIVLASRPDGAPSPDNFRLETSDMPSPGAGEILVKVAFMSLDPYMRGRMDDAKSYAAPVPLGGKMEGGSVGHVIASNAEGFAEGDAVFGPFGWASHAVADASMCRKLNPDLAPITTALGVLGMPGFTGWYGLNEIGKPKAGETLLVAAATGPVGSMVGQLAKAKGLRAVGVAGGPDKCRLATETFGFDACVDHRAFDKVSDLRDALKEAAPDGVDVYFENVGGPVLEATLPQMNRFGRIPLCGMIAWYNAGGLGDGASSQGLTGPKLWRTLLVNHLTVTGFIIANHWDRYGEFLKEVAPMVADGRVKYEEDITEGLKNAPQAFMDMLRGGNTGKTIVKVG